MKTSIRCPLPKVLADEVHLQDWAVLAKEKILFRNLGQFGSCAAKDVQTGGRFWVHCGFHGFERQVSHNKAACSLTDESCGEGVRPTGISATFVKEYLM